MGFIFFHRDPAVFRHVDLNFPHVQHHDHDLGVYRHVFCQQDMSSLQVCSFPGHVCAFPLERFAEFIHHAAGKKRLGYEGVNARTAGFLRHLVPVI